MSAMLGSIIFVVIQLGILGGLYLLFRIVYKMSVLTSICMVFLILPVPALFGVRLFYRSDMAYFGKMTWMGMLLLAAICGVIVLVQFFRWVAKGDLNSGGVVTTEERQKTLKMVDEGKITSQEASELLEALGRSNAMRGQDTFSRLDMIILVGIGLVVLGFFLPWVHISINLPSLLGTSGYQAGYHTGSIGWAVIIIAILSALPVFITPKDYLYKLSMLQIFLLILGGVITISLLMQARELGAGLWFCLVGFIISGIASMMKFKQLAA